MVESCGISPCVCAHVLHERLAAKTIRDLLRCTSAARPWNFSMEGILHLIDSAQRLTTMSQSTEEMSTQQGRLEARSDDEHLVSPSTKSPGITASVLATVDGDEENTTFMQDGFGHERLERDARDLLHCYVNGGDCRAVLHDIPLFKPRYQPLAAPFDKAVRMLCADEVNCTAALQVRSCLTSSLVLMHTIALSQGIPSVFFVDVLLKVNAAKMVVGLKSWHWPQPF